MSTQANPTIRPKPSWLKLVGFFLVLAMLSWGVYECKYQYSLWSDYKDRPWAYSRDKNTKLLVGVWTGSFTDPNGVSKTLMVEIESPVSENERKEKAGRKWKKRGGLRHQSKINFDGSAAVNSPLGTEKYEIYGAVEKEDFHQLHFNFRPENETERILPNFLLAFAQNGIWQEDQLTLTLTFSYHRKDGSSFSSSADPKYEKKITIKLHRQP